MKTSNGNLLREACAKFIPLADRLEAAEVDALTCDQAMEN
jgi:hypothetical protein